MKKFFRTIHLYLGLAAGIVIMISCATGAILVFEKEWQAAIYPERYTVAPSSEQINLDKSISSLKKEVKGATVTSIKVFGDKTRSLEVTYSEKKTRDKRTSEKKETKSKKEEKPEPGKGPGKTQAFMNPQTGELISLYNHRNTFFFTVFSLHRWLLSGNVGKTITGISTLIFVFILITGIILWWPKTKAKLKQHLTLKWGAQWKRINHDLHVVLGFYASIILFASAFTGLAWSHDWFNKGIYWITNSEDKRMEAPPSVLTNDSTVLTFAEAYVAIQKIVPEAVSYTINAPKDSAGSFQINVMPLDAPHESASDQYYFNQYDGSLLATALHKDKNLGQKVRSVFYPIHVGSIGGTVGKILSFVACILGVTFPVTGTILWINRIRKEKNKNVKQVKRQLASARVLAEAE